MTDWIDADIATAMLSALCSLIVLLVVWLMSRHSATQRHQIAQQREKLTRDFARLEVEQRRFLTGRDLSPIYDKINGVAQDVAALRAESCAVSQQLRIINKHLLKQS